LDQLGVLDGVGVGTLLLQSVEQACQILFALGSYPQLHERGVLVLDPNLEIEDLVVGAELDDLVEHTGEGQGVEDVALQGDGLRWHVSNAP
jgi:hypothetical protein